MKKTKYTLDDVDLDDDLDLAYLLFRSQDAGYLFVDNLNHLYRLALRRIDDMPFPPPTPETREIFKQANPPTTPYPFYTYSDPVAHLNYFLIEKPSAAAPSGAWQPSDKLLIIKGEGAPLEAESIYDDFTAPQRPDPDDLLALQHAELRDQMIREFTVVNLLDFSAPAPANTRDRAARDRVTLEQHCNLLLSYIEHSHLDLPDAERQYLRSQE